MNYLNGFTRWIAGLSLALFALGAQAAPAPAAKPVNMQKCYSCHDNIEEFHAKGKHAKVNCASCHTGTDEHLASKDKKAVKPVTIMDHRACATCHKDQYESFVRLNYDSPARLEKATFKGRSPLFDKLMEGYGFTKEHGEPRSHAFMLVDQWVVDRGFGGRFQFKDWTYNTKAEAAANSAWDVIVDKEPSTSDQKKFMRQTVTAVNPVCMNCKTQDHILDWAYKGDKHPAAKWDRTSKPVEFARAMKHPLNCFMCHDPHSTGPRVVRDALIEAVVDRNEGTYPMDAEKSKKTTMTKVTFDRDGKPFRAIGLLNKADSNLMCAQCHVEYNCGGGFDCANPANPAQALTSADGAKKVGMADPRTNLFTWVNVFGYKDKMVGQFNFKDFQHASTGALLPKIQHPEMETYWGSKHEKAGVQCKDCHMGKAKNAQGKTYTNHQQKSPKSMLKETCLRCHTDWTEHDAKYNMEAIQNYTRGKMAKAEFWIANLIDTIMKAKEVGVSKEVLNKAYDYQYDANLYWEWWTAENSDGFHNPDDARESLTKSIDASQEGIAMLRKAMAEMRAGSAPAAAAPAAEKKY
jgi:formate-dependent nitrite reductase cytochrome c552 subunit